MRVADAGFDGCRIKIQTGKIARIGGITKTQINAIGTVVHGCFEGRQAASRADQFHRGCGCLRRRAGQDGISNEIHKSLVKLWKMLVMVNP